MGDGERGGGGQPDWLGRVAGAAHLGGAVMVRTLTDWRDGRVIWTGEAKTIQEALTAAIGTGANLYGVNLRGANLDGANLSVVNMRGARLSGADMTVSNLRGAKLSVADLRGANLYGADMTGADLYGADMTGANLYGATLTDANLYGADLRGATMTGAVLYGVNLRGAYLTSTLVLLANFGSVSDELCADLMVYDAANHPDPSAFGRWAAGGECPYSGVRVGRVANFKQRKECWREGRVALSAFELMKRVLRETCADSDYHEKAVR